MGNTQNIINLESLLDLTARLYESVDEHFILNSTLLSLMGKLKIIRGAVLIKNSDKRLIPLIVKGNLLIEEMDIAIPLEFTKIIELENSHFQDNSFTYILPIKKDNDNIYAVILLGKSLSDIELTENEENYINLISNITANAISNARNFKSYKFEKLKVEKQNQLLTTLFEISKDFSRNFSSDQIVKTLALNLMGQLTVTRFALFGLNIENKYVEIVNRFGHKIDLELLYGFNEIDFAKLISECELSEDTLKFCRHLDLKVIAPMIVQGERRGLLIIGRKMNSSEFSDENLLFIEALGNSAMAALENERLFREEIEKKRLENELSIALDIQKNLLPDQNPQLNNFDIAGITIPSQHVGGDLYDFIPLANNNHIIAIADVSGKGIPASLIMANFQAALRVLSMSGLPLREIVEKINNLLYHNTSADKFVTSFFAIIDDNSGLIRYINAGHNPPYLLRNTGLIEPLSTGGLILGFMEHPFEFQIGEVYLDKDEFIICYTDGVTEADGIDGIDYGEERLQKFTSNCNGLCSNSIISNLVKSVKDYLGDSHQNDDITIVVIKKVN